jgi:GTP-binding protein
MRLERETATNVALRIDPNSSTDAIRLFGRGELQIAILIEQMRREGLEMCVSKPEVITKEVDGKVHEPYEIAICDFPEEYMGIVMELMNTRKGRMMQMKHLGSGRIRVEYRVPSRGLVGFRGYYLNDTRGQGLLNRQFEGYDEYAGYIPYRKNGSLVADRLGHSTAYALYKLEERGSMFIGAQEQVYEGMIVGEASRENDINVNVVRAKQLTNIRSAGADEKLILTPKVVLTLEKALEYIAEDELVEITPAVVRIRKKVLAANQRSIVRGERRDKK